MMNTVMPPRGVTHLFLAPGPKRRQLLFHLGVHGERGGLQPNLPFGGVLLLAPAVTGAVGSASTTAYQQALGCKGGGKADPRSTTGDSTSTDWLELSILASARR